MQNPENQYSEINLADYVRVILKRWKLIFLIFILAIISAFSFSIFSPKIYKIDTSLEIGRVGGELIESPVQLVEKINNQVYNGEYEIGVKALNLANTNLVSMVIESVDFEKAKSVLEEINNLILQEHNVKTEIQRRLIRKDIEQLSSKIALLDKNIGKTQNKIRPIENDIVRTKNKISHTNEEKNNLENKVAALEQVLVYEQTPGTQFALFDAKEKLENKKQEIEDLYLNINSLERSIQDLNIEINSLMSQKDNLELEINALNKSLDEVKSTGVIKEPTVSKAPIKPRPLLNTAIAGVLGLFIGVFLAFSREWYQKAF